MILREDRVDRNFLSFLIIHLLFMHEFFFSLVWYAAAPRFNEVWTKEQEEAHGIFRHKRLGVKSPEPHTYVKDEDLPESFTWCDNDGNSS